MIKLHGKCGADYTAGDVIEQLKAGRNHLDIDSSGGRWAHAYEINEFIYRHRQPVTAHVSGVAQSSAAVIAIGASRLTMAPGAGLLFHKAYFNEPAKDRASEIERVRFISAQLRYTAVLMQRRMRCNIGLPMRLIRRSTSFTAQQAVSIGLADLIKG